jgi:hypothetical protein
MAFRLGSDLETALIQVNNQLAENARRRSLHHGVRRSGRSVVAPDPLPQRGPGTDPPFPGGSGSLRALQADKASVGSDAIVIAAPRVIVEMRPGDILILLSDGVL